jgi:hypothetical protein
MIKSRPPATVPSRRLAIAAIGADFLDRSAETTAVPQTV